MGLGFSRRREHRVLFGASSFFVDSGRGRRTVASQHGKNTLSNSSSSTAVTGRPGSHRAIWLTDLCEHLAGRGRGTCGLRATDSRSPARGFNLRGMETHRGVFIIHRLAARRDFPKRVPAGRLLKFGHVHAGDEANISAEKKSGTPGVFITRPPRSSCHRLSGEHHAKLRGRVGSSRTCRTFYPDVAERGKSAAGSGDAAGIREKLPSGPTNPRLKIVVLGSCMKDRARGGRPGPSGMRKNRNHPQFGRSWDVHPNRIEHDDNPLRKSMDLDDRFVVMHSGQTWVLKNPTARTF